jgi:hypothetical protein
MPVLLSPPVLPSPPALLSPPFDPHAFLADAKPLLERFTDWVRVLRRAAPPRDPNDTPVPTAVELRHAIQHRMSAAAGILRSRGGVERALAEAGEEWRALEKRGWRTLGKAGARAVTWLPAWELRELALAQRAFLESVRDLIAHGGGSRGSYFVTSPEGRRPLEALDADWAALPENKALREVILGVRYDARRDRFVATETPVRPIPAAEDPWFETVWADFRERRVFRR